MVAEAHPQIPTWEQFIPQKADVRLEPPVHDYEIEIVTTMQNMANTVIANAASRSLARYVTNRYVWVELMH